MENPLLRPDEEPNDDSENTTESRSKRQRVSQAINQTLQSWLQRKSLAESQSIYNSPEDEEDDEDDDETEAESKKKTAKVRRFFKLFFSNQVKKEPMDQPETKPSEVGAPDDSEVTVDNGEQRAEERPEISGSDDLSTLFSTEALTAPVEKAGLSHKTPARSESPLDPVVAARFEQATRAAATADRLKQEVEVPLRDGVDSSGGEGGRSFVDLDEKVSEATFRRAETINKLRNRKRRKEIRRTREDVDVLKKDHKHTTAEIKRELRDVAREQKQAPTQTVVETTTNTPLPPVRERAESVSAERERPPESVKEILAKRQVVEKIRTPSAGANDKIPTPETLTQTHYEKLRPETVLAQVEKAAEKDIAIEGLFERRHETKDVNTSSQQAGAASGGSSSVQPVVSPVSVVASQQPMASTPVAASAPASPKRAEPSPEEYRRAIHHGLWAAMVLLIFIAMLAFVR